MIQGMYSATTALEGAAQRQELIAENLAHAATPGYRARNLTFATLVQTLPSGESKFLGTSSTGTAINFESGPLQHTGSPLDLALNGDAFFVLDGPSGPLYTRNGAFVLNAQGELTSASGFRVAGAIRIPAEAQRIGVSQDGAILADNVEVGRLRLASFPDTTVLEPAGTTLFRGPNGGEPAPGTFRVEQGYREGSNVQVVHEMVAMITGLRHYEAAERALRALHESTGQNTQPQA